MAAVREVVESYFAAWNAPDPITRMQLLERSFADEGVLITPRAGRVSGRQAVLEHIGGLAQRFAGARVVPTSGIDEHHGVLRYSWRIVTADGSPLVDGTDFGELASDGRLLRIAEFDDRPPGTA